MANPMLSPNPSTSPQPLPTNSHLSVRIIAVPVKSVRQDAKPEKWYKRLSTSSVLPVVNRQKRLVGVIRDRDLLQSPDFRISDFKLSSMRPEGAFLSDEPITAFKATDTLADAYRLFRQVDQSYIPLVDAKGRYSGQCISRTLFYQWLNGELRPGRVGGLATPLGVYMTSGYYSSGSGWKGLVATGVMFGIMAYLLDWLCLVVYSALLTLFPTLNALPEGQLALLQFGILLFLMLAILRLSPMSGLHAAEHMTINALESGLPLTERMVRKQPREHARCGTNLMALLMGLELGALSVITLYGEVNIWGLALYGMLWLAFVFRFWKPAGLWIQRYFTTKDPSVAQLASGLRAGEEMLEKFRERPHPHPSFLRRIWGSGLFHMAVSFLLTGWLLSRVFGFVGF